MKNDAAAQLFYYVLHLTKPEGSNSRFQSLLTAPSGKTNAGAVAEIRPH